MTATVARARQLVVELLQVLDALSEQPELPLSPTKGKAKTKRTDRPALLLAHYERVMAAAGRAIGVALTPANRGHVACLDPYEMGEAEALIAAYCNLEDAFCSVEGYPLRLLPDKLPKVLAAREAAAAKQARVASAAQVQRAGERRPARYQRPENAPTPTPETFEAQRAAVGALLRGISKELPAAERPTKGQ